MACFLIGATGPEVTASGEAFLGSVSDDPYDVRTVVRALNSSDGLGYVGTELVFAGAREGLEPPFTIEPGEVFRAVNEAGLAFTCAMVFEEPPGAESVAPVPFARLSEGLVSRCRTVDEAIALFQEVGAVSPAFSVLLADASGNLAHLEMGSYGVAIHHRCSAGEPGVVMAVNCYRSACFAGHNDPSAVLDNRANNNAWRLERGRALASEGRGSLDVSWFARILSDHANRERDPQGNLLVPGWGYSICNHGTRRLDHNPRKEQPWGTVSAEIMQPSTRTLHYAYGWPCGGQPEFGDQVYQENSWGRFIPFGLAPPGAGPVVEYTTLEGERTEAGNPLVGG